MKIYDCFNFFNELDILEIRLNILKDYVDYFVIVESSIKHSGEPKEFIFEKNIDRFAAFKEKIIYYKVYDTPNNFIHLSDTNDKTLNLIYQFIINQKHRFDRHNQPDYGRDFFQKECMRRPLINCNDEDLILISDADEIINPKVIEDLSKLDIDNNIYSLNQPTYYYYLNLLKDSNWHGTKMSKYKNIKNISFNEIRGDESLSIKIPNGGWHFSFMGGKEMVKNKLISYSARDLVDGYILENIENNMDNNIDPFFRNKLNKIEIDSTFPDYILNNLEKYKKMIK